MKTITTTTLVISFIFLLSGCMTWEAVSISEANSHVYEIPGKLKNKLFLDANNWMVSTFNSAESVIEYSDKEEGAIIGKYLLSGHVRNSTYSSIDTRVYAKINIWVKDNKAKIDIKPTGEWNYDASGMTVYNYSPEQATADMNALADDFYKAIQKQTTTNW